jgi:hypothetical protein
LTGAQVPSGLPVSASRHDEHVPVQPSSQQIPSAQELDVHSTPAAQPSPRFFLGVHVPLAQKYPDTQSASLPQGTLHLPAAQACGAQFIGDAAGHSPLPSQRRSGDKVLPSQDAGTQTASVPQRRQAPAPSQVPSAPQVSWPVAVQSSSGSRPAWTGAQAPSLPPVSLPRHDRQPPPQASSQHTPSMHWPEVHCPPLRHGAPLARFLRSSAASTVVTGASETSARGASVAGPSVLAGASSSRTRPSTPGGLASAGASSLAASSGPGGPGGSSTQPLQQRTAQATPSQPMEALVRNDIIRSFS